MPEVGRGYGHPGLIPQPPEELFAPLPLHQLENLIGTTCVPGDEGSFGTR
jgi:hypothetical protein